MTTKQAEWKEYTGSDEQIAEIMNARLGFILRDKFTKYESPRFRVLDKDIVLANTEYLILNPHPLKSMIIRQAQTGQPVYIKTNIFLEHYGDCCSYMETTTPDWNIPNAEYRFTPFDQPEPRPEVMDAFNKSINKFDAMYKTIKD